MYHMVNGSIRSEKKLLSLEQDSNMSLMPGGNLKSFMVKKDPLIASPLRVCRNGPFI